MTRVALWRAPLINKDLQFLFHFQHAWLRCQCNDEGWISTLDAQVTYYLSLYIFLRFSRP